MIALLRERQPCPLPIEGGAGMPDRCETNLGDFWWQSHLSEWKRTSVETH